MHEKIGVQVLEYFADRAYVAKDRQHDDVQNVRRSHTHWKVAAAIAVLAAAALPHVTKPIDTFSSFLPALLTLAIAGSLGSAGLLFARHLTHGRPASAILGGVFVFSALDLLFFGLAAPGGFTNNGIFEQHFAIDHWLWHFWQLGMPIGIFGALAAEYLTEVKHIDTAARSWTSGACATIAVAVIAAALLLLIAFPGMMPQVSHTETQA